VLKKTLLQQDTFTRNHIKYDDFSNKTQFWLQCDFSFLQHSTVAQMEKWTEADVLCVDMRSASGNRAKRRWDERQKCA